MKKIYFSLLTIVCLLITQISFAQDNAIYPANSLTPGSQNSTVGHNAGASLIPNSQGNTLLGVGAGFREEGDHNTIIGGFASVNVNNGFENTTLGYYAGSDFTAYASKYNVNLGAFAGYRVKGNGNIFIGWRAGENAGNFDQKLYINSGAGTPLIYGDFVGNTAGINTTAPITTFDVRGNSAMVTDPTTTAGNINSNRAAIAGETDGFSCKLYGFRAQTDRKYLVTMGMNEKTPTIYWGEGDLNFSYRNPIGSSPCAQRLLRLGNNVGGSGLQLVFEGSGLVTGSWTVLSDRKVKQNIKGISNAIDLVKQLNGVSYEYNADAAPDKIFPEGKVYGFIAQDVQKVIPEVTTTVSESNLVGIKYTEIIPVLTEAIKEQQGTIEEQKDKITALEDRLAIIEKMLLGEKEVNASENKLTNDLSKNVQLAQNRPNPFGNTTIIDYNLDKDVQQASLDVYDINGQLIQTTAIASGKGSVELDASLLKNGTYIYAINAGGKNIATKIMIVQK